MISIIQSVYILAYHSDDYNMPNKALQLIAKSAVSLRSIGLLAPTELNRYNLDEE